MSDSALVPIAELVPAKVFGPGGIDSILSGIAAAARAHVADTSTAKGRAEIASLAHRVARSKTALDGMGKDLVAEWKKRSAAVDEERKRARDFLDSLRDEVRRPLTEYEEAEERRTAELERRVAAVRAMGEAGADVAAELEALISRVRAVAIGDEWAEHAGSAALAKDAALTRLDARLSAARQREAAAAREAAERAAREAAEAQAAAERAQREAAEREAREAAEAAQRAAREAQEARERAERERQAEARREAEAAERARQAEAEAERRAAAAVEAERRRVAAEERAKAEAEARRLADVEHRRKINAGALEAIADLGAPPELAKAIVLAIVNGEIPHVSIRY